MISGSLKSLHSLWVNLARNHRYQQFIEERDISEFTKRLENEGLTFLTTTLPSIGKALDEFHASHTWNRPKGFKCSKDDGIPLFMGSVIKKSLAGHSLAVDCVRQMTLIFYKLEVAYDSSIVEDFISTFKKVDLGLLALDFDQENLEQSLELMRKYIGRVLCNADPLDIRPYHGSGATSCRTKNYDKWHKLRYYPDLDAVFSYDEYFFYNPTHLIDELDRLEEAQNATPCARVVLVPKDSRGPRVISCEPAELMYIQQGLMGKLYETIETHPLTRRFVNFVDQSINRDLAHHASKHDDLATLDLSEASDRVAWELVRRVFPPRWVEALSACRSPRTILPDGAVVELNKFAPMGSSCCFPVEALLFWACASASIYSDFGAKCPNVWVYGDDIIIDSAYAESVMKGLESVGLLVNRKKTYVSGPFRESCGGDYHNGMDVTPVRVRHFLSRVGTGIATSSDLCNSFVAKFGEVDSRSLISIVEEELDYIFPRSEMPLPGTLRVTSRSSNDVFFRRRYNKSLQRIEHRVLVYKARVLTRRLPTWCELLKKELSRGRQCSPYSREGMMPQSIVPLDPGDYADPYSAQQVWSWAWLG